MKLLLTFLFVTCVAIVLFMSGCDLKNPDQGVTSNSPPPPKGRDLLITEAFALSPDKFYSYSWIELYNPTKKPIDWFQQVLIASGYAIGDGGTIIKTVNTGAAWAETLSNASYGDLHSLFFPQPLIGYAVGNNGTILKIDTFGVHLHDKIVGVPANFASMNLNGIGGIVDDIQARTLFAVGDGGTILRTIDKGVTWTKQPASGNVTAKNLHAVYSLAFPNIFVVGDSGSFYFSANAGSAWSPKIIPEPFRTTNFYTVNFSSRSLLQFGWAAGDGGAILATTNGGSLWLPETSNVSASLRGAFFPRQDELLFPVGYGWIVGDGGTIIRTKTSGAQWEVLTSGVTTNLNSVTFVDSSRGWAFGDGGLVLFTDDGGDSWTAQGSGTTQSLHGSFFTPLTDTAQQIYSLQMIAKRDAIFFDPATGTQNPDVVTPLPDGPVFFATQATITPGAFEIVTNDVNKFNNHTRLGPGVTSILSFTYAIALGEGPFGFSIVKWNLLPSSELRLVKVFIRAQRRGNASTNADTTITTLDVVRFGGYKPLNPLDYPNNIAADAIPEWWSLARYSDDLGDDPSKENTRASFFLTSNPIPGWLSQQRKPH
jgi:photosystem II stability/assembly factor-like uncharacterized protein